MKSSYSLADSASSKPIESDLKFVNTDETNLKDSLPERYKYTDSFVVESMEEKLTKAFNQRQCEIADDMANRHIDDCLRLQQLGKVLLEARQRHQQQARCLALLHKRRQVLHQRQVDHLARLRKQQQELHQNSLTPVTPLSYCGKHPLSGRRMDIRDFESLSRLGKAPLAKFILHIHRQSKLDLLIDAVHDVEKPTTL